MHSPDASDAMWDWVFFCVSLKQELQHVIEGVEADALVFKFLDDNSSNKDLTTAFKWATKSCSYETLASQHEHQHDR